MEALKEITLNVAPGVGDSFWAYQKFAPHFDIINFILCPLADGPLGKRAEEFLKLLPKTGQVKSRMVSNIVQRNLVNQRYFIGQIIEAHRKGKKHFNYCCNLPLERGVRLEDIDPNFTIERTVDIRAESYPIPYKKYICLMISGLTMHPQTRHQLGLWNPQQWIKFISITYRTYKLEYPIVMIGAGWDRKTMVFISDALRKNGIEIETYVNLPPINVCHIIKNAIYFIGFQSGLNIIADNFDVPQTMLYFPNLHRMMYTWCKWKNMNNKIFNAVTFTNTVSQVVKEIEKQAKFLKYQTP